MVLALFISADAKLTHKYENDGRIYNFFNLPSNLKKYNLQKQCLVSLPSQQGGY